MYVSRGWGDFTKKFKLNIAISGLKKSPQAWCEKLNCIGTFYGFKCSMADPSIFISTLLVDLFLLIVYVDGVLLTAIDRNDIYLEKSNHGNHYVLKDNRKQCIFGYWVF